jgi:hypothetical protein
MGGRRLPTGYTTSTWIYNLALFEATQDDYRQLTEAALRAATGMDPAEDLHVAGRESGGVERQYTDLLMWGPTSARPPVETLIRCMSEWGQPTKYFAFVGCQQVVPPADGRDHRSVERCRIGAWKFEHLPVPGHARSARVANWTKTWL